MNRNVIKIIACLAMLVDHLGLYVFDNFLPFRIIGRVAFPIFAYLIADGLKYTRSRKKYIITLTIFAIISQIPYIFLNGYYKLNILFSYLIAIAVIYLIEHIKTLKFSAYFLLTIIFCGLILSEPYGVVDYGIFGILATVVCYFAHNKTQKFILFAVMLLFLSCEQILLNKFSLLSFIQFFALLSVPILCLYNNKKGKLNLKWLFYAFYPAHLTVVLIISLII